MENSDKKQVGILAITIAVCTVILAIGCAVKIALSTMSITIDFATLLSVVLALFSVALSVQFYFKATETSNAFYDNTYKYTKDIAELLVKIEASFGEKLSHLDAGYRSFVESQKLSQIDPEIKRKLEQEKAELEKVLEDRTKIIEQLIASTHLAEGEKERITDELKAKDEELVSLNRHVNRLRAEMRVQRERKNDNDGGRDSGFKMYTVERVVRAMGSDIIMHSDMNELKQRFNELSVALSKAYIRDLQSYGYYSDDSLTTKGVKFLRELAIEDDIP